LAITAITVALLVVSVGDAFSQAWVREKGGYFFSLSASYLETGNEFNFTGEELPIFAEDLSRSNTSYRDIAFRSYLEYGVFTYLTVVWELEYKIVTAEETITPIFGAMPLDFVRTNHGLSDTRLSLRLPLIQHPFAVAIQAGAKIPLGYEQFPENGGPPLGTGEVDGEVQINYGLSFYPVPAYLTAGIGYRVRGGILNDEYFYNAEIGYAIHRVAAKIRFDALQNTGTVPDLIGGTVETPIPGGVLSQVIVGDQEAYRVNPRVSVGIRKGISAYVEAFHVVAGKNFVAGTSYSAGIVLAR